MPRKPNPSSGTFAFNLQLLLRSLKMTQVEFGTDLEETPKTTVNKWLNGGVVPQADKLGLITQKYNLPKDWEKMDPREFGAKLNLGRDDVDEILKLPTISMRNIRVPRSDTSLSEHMGFYHLYMPSLKHPNHFVQRALRLYEDSNGRYYYEAINAADNTLDNDTDEMTYFGSIVVSGPPKSGNMILIGGDRLLSSVQFMIFGLPPDPLFEPMAGVILGEFNGDPFSNPIIAVRIPKPRAGEDFADLAPHPVYIPDEALFAAHPKVAEHFFGVVERYWLKTRMIELQHKSQLRPG